MTREDILNELDRRGVGELVKVVYKKISPYMKARYKQEYITPEAWIYPKGYKGFGYLITEEDWNDKEDYHAKSLFDTLVGEVNNCK